MSYFYKRFFEKSVILKTTSKVDLSEVYNNEYF